MRKILFALFLAGPAIASQVTEGPTALINGSTIVKSHPAPGLAACKADIALLSGGLKRYCRTEFTTVAVPVPPIPPTPVPPIPTPTASAVWTDVLAAPVDYPLTVCTNAPIVSVTIAGQTPAALETNVSRVAGNDCWRVAIAAGVLVVNGVTGPTIATTAGVLRTATPATISAALSAVKSGDAILLSAGSYPGNYRFTQKGGFAFTSAVGAAVTVNGVGGADDSHAGQSAGITLSNITFTGRNASDGCPVNLQNGANGWRVVNNELTWPNAPSGAKCAGIAGNGSGVSILGNNIHDITGGSENHGIYFDSGTKGAEVAYNNVQNVTGGNLFQTFDNIGSGALTGFSVHHNVFRNGGRYGLNLSDSTASLIAYENVVDTTVLAAVRLNVNADFVVDIDIHDNQLLKANTKGSGSSHAAIECDNKLTRGSAKVRSNVITLGAGATDGVYDPTGNCPNASVTGNTVSKAVQ